LINTSRLVIDKLGGGLLTVVVIVGIVEVGGIAGERSTGEDREDVYPDPVDALDFVDPGP
jgi:hypothetical protein